jgi:hypothetical protein
MNEKVSVQEPVNPDGQRTAAQWHTFPSTLTSGLIAMCAAQYVAELKNACQSSKLCCRRFEHNR